MGKEDARMKLPVKVKLNLKDGQRLSWERVKFTATPVGVFIVDLDKPDITRVFPWGNIREVEIPATVESKKIIRGVPGVGSLG